MLKLLCSSSILAVIVLSACQPPATFIEPQPKDVAALSEFPQRIQGKYLNTEDSTFLQISANSMIRIYDFNEKIHLNDLDSTEQIIGDSLYDLNTNTSQFIRVEGDSIVMHEHEIDTLFIISKLNVLKKYKGYYFINMYNQDENWEVKKLGFSHSKLILSSINTKQELKQLKAMTISTQDTMPYVFSLSRRQFKKFVRDEGFRDTEEYLKIGN
jgi:hypothetical protein